MTLQRITACRACGSRHLQDAVDLGAQYDQGAFTARGAASAAELYPTELVRCDAAADPEACGLLQRAYATPDGPNFSSYWSRSGVNKTMRDHLRGLVGDAIVMTGLDAPSVLDIGCNDGTLLSYYPKSATRFGVDPSDVASAIGSWANVVSDVFPSEAACKAIGGRTFDIVTTVAMFDSVEDPAAFARAIRKVLGVKGVWVLETSYLPLMLARNAYDGIRRERVGHYSLAVLEHVMSDAGLKIVRGELNEAKGGSIRLYITHAEQGGYDRDQWLDALADIWDREAELNLNGGAPYRAFQMRLEGLRDELARVVSDIHERGETIHLYGASTGGNTLLQWCGLSSGVIRYAADRNPIKVGTRLPGGEIEVISETASRGMRPDYYLVLPWTFRREILEREREAIFNGAQMIFPLPHLRFVTADNYATELSDAMMECQAGAGVETLRAILDAARGRLRVIDGDLERATA
ncbi:MAG: methyltransferase domain-containing protein [Pseudomonadota bacterium]